LKNLRNKANSLPAPLSHKGRREAETKLRTDGRSCPLCLRRLPSLSGKGKTANACAACDARRQPGKRCAKCHAEAIWETKTLAACQACGAHGSKLRVVADALER
jgi:hypothetical protein